MRRLRLLAVVLATPLLVAAASDRRGDVTSCVDGTAVDDHAADIVRVDALADELGTAAVWRIRFASALAVLDRDGVPLRIDVLVRDPRLPAVSLGDEHGMNRIVRWDATAADAPVDIVWLSGNGHTPFNPPAIDGRTVEIRVPGRILLGEAEDGTESVRRARWSVLVRDGEACDRVGGRPVYRLRAPLSPSPSPGGAASVPPAAAPSATGGIPIGPIVIGLAIGISYVGVALARRARR